MEISITVEGFGLAWDRWKALVKHLEQCGFAGIYKSDHFTDEKLPLDDHLEVLVALTYLASHIPRVHFGTMVSPLSFRDPVMLARQAMAIDDLSGGRMILGLGTGWLQLEHTMFGYELGTIKQRFDRLEEGLEVITQLIRSDDPVTFEGQYFQLRDAILLPCPRRKTPVLIGGAGPKRTLPLVARYADMWNCQGSLENFREKMDILDELLIAEERQPGDVKRTHTTFFGCWQSETERNQILDDFPESTQKQFNSRDDLQAFLLHQIPKTSPDRIVEHFKAFEDAGCEEIILHYMGMKGNTQLDILAEHILPHFN